MNKGSNESQILAEAVKIKEQVSKESVMLRQRGLLRDNCFATVKSFLVTFER